MVTVTSGFRTSNLSITGPTRLPTVLTGPTWECVCVCMCKGVGGGECVYEKSKLSKLVA
jgi:hypothetical protein